MLYTLWTKNICRFVVHGHFWTMCQSLTQFGKGRQIHQCHANSGRGPIVLWLIMERSQNIPGLGSRISKFRDIHFIYFGTDINHWMFQGDRLFGVAMTSIQTFSEVRSLDVIWWPDLEWPGPEIFRCAEKMHEQVNQKRWRCAPPFLRY